jgi:hypothetical protein
LTKRTFWAAGNFHFDRLRAVIGKYAEQFIDIEKYREIRRDFSGDSLIYDPNFMEDVLPPFPLKT